MPGPSSTRTRKSGKSAAPVVTRPFGRSLDDFGRLSVGERKLLDCCRTGQMAIIAEERPESETSANRVRAGFVRFLALGGDQKAVVHENGVQLRGAWLTGVLGLDAARVDHFLSLVDCTIERVDVLQCQLKFLNLGGSKLTEGLMGDRLRCEGGVFLRAGFHATGIVRLLGASIAGDLDCGDGCFENPGDNALACHGAVVSGYMFLRRGFRATGEVGLTGVRIAGDLDCGGGTFENPQGHALLCDGAVVSGRIYLHGGFSATGGLTLIGTRVGGDIRCDGGSFENEEGEALTCDNVHIGGAFYLRRVAKMGGSINLSSAHVGTLCDDTEVWGSSLNNHVLDGFTYDRLGGGAPTEAAKRILWLDSQRANHLGQDFRPQPWEHLIVVLRAMGHPNEARTVAVAKQDRVRRAGKIVRGARLLHSLYGVFVGYGYRPARLMTAIVLVWLGCAAAYWTAVNPAWFGSATHLMEPANGQPNQVCLIARIAARSGDPCPPSPPNYHTFAPLIYSADVLLPIVSLGYKEEWRPAVVDGAGRRLIWGERLRALYWFEIALGWLFGGALVAMLSNLIKKD